MTRRFLPSGSPEYLRRTDDWLSFPNTHGSQTSFNFPFALETAARLLQVTPVDGVTPYERRYGSRPDVSYVRTFGCRVLVLNPSKYPKYGPRARPDILLSLRMPQYSFETYKAWDVKTSRVIHSRDVVFFEENAGYRNT